MKLKIQYLVFSTAFLLASCTSANLDLEKREISRQDLNKLIQQLEYGKPYWNESGKAIWTGNLDMLEVVNHKRKAAVLLGELARNGVQVNAAVPLLIKNLKHNESEYIEDNGMISVRSSSAYALGIIKDPRAIDGLIELFKESQQCLNTQPAPRCKMSPSSNDLSGTIERRSKATIALGNIGIKRLDVINLLMSGLKDKSPKFLSDCATALAKLEADQAIDVLIDRIQNDPNKSIQSAAVESLGKFSIKAQKALPILIQRIENSVESADIEMTVLGEIGTQKAINTIHEFAKNSNPKIRDSSINVIDNIKRRDKKLPL